MRLKVLVNYGVFREGFDAPKTRAIIVARPVYSPNLYFQMIGRGLRGVKNGGNERCLVLNVSDNIRNFWPQPCLLRTGLVVGRLIPGLPGSSHKACWSVLGKCLRTERVRLLFAERHSRCDGDRVMVVSDLVDVFVGCTSNCQSASIVTCLFSRAQHQATMHHMPTAHLRDSKLVAQIVGTVGTVRRSPRPPYRPA